MAILTGVTCKVLDYTYYGYVSCKVLGYDHARWVCPGSVGYTCADPDDNIGATLLFADEPYQAPSN